MSYNDYGYNPYEEPDYSSHPNSGYFTSADCEDGIVGGQYWDGSSWKSLPDDRDSGGGYPVTYPKPKPEPVVPNKPLRDRIDWVRVLFVAICLVPVVFLVVSGFIEWARVR